MHMTHIAVGDLNALDLSRGFLETLSGLSEANLTFEEAVKVLRNRLRSGIYTYVARAGEEVAGTATLLVEDKFIHNGGRVGHIEDVAVHPGYQKQGIGAALIEHAVSEAKRLGCYKVILNCYEHVAPFYEKLGFRRQDLGMRLDLK
jgi:glucosamine-phosphate N-acetyltransferase